MLYTWGGIVLLIMFGALQASGAVDFTIGMWLYVAVAALMTLGVDVLRSRLRPATVSVPSKYGETAVYTTR